MDNMKIWDQVKKTDPSATKSNSNGGFKSTSINGYWMIQKATEVWGPLGDGWSYEILEDKFDDGAPIVGDDGQVICMSKMHTIKISLTYQGADKAVIQYGHTPYIYKTQRGPITDMEAPKKSLMDAIKKALSMLGFSADVFQGEFDDQNYVEELRNQEALKKADNKDEERLRQEKEYKDWYQQNLDLVKTAQSMNELEKLFKAAALKMQRRRDDAGLKSMTLAKDARKKQLEGEQS